MENRLSVSTAEWKGYISTAYAELFALVAETGLRYFETHTEFTADGSVSYDEPEDMHMLVGVDFLDPSGRRRELIPLAPQERNLYAGQTGEAYYYEFIDDQLYLYPKPSSGTYEWLYVQQPPDMTNEADGYLVDVVTPGGEAFVIWDVAVQAFAKEGSDVNVARAEREEARGRVLDWALMRLLHEHSRNVLHDRVRGRDPGEFPPWGGA